MKTVCKVNECSGCGLCKEKCSMGAISIDDSLDAYNAVINEDICVECKLCKNICPNNINVKFKKTIQWYQGWAKNKQIRANSTSGGVAAAISRSFVKKFNGAICSCVYENGRFVYKIAETLADLDRYAGSKYVKSDLQGSYKIIGEKLKQGQRVLFIGLPCQVAAIRNYVGDENGDLLYLVDLICHGSPSPKLLKVYLYEQQQDITVIEDIKFRQKNNYKLFVKKTDEKKYISIESKAVQNLYSFAYQKSLINTESCYNCKYAKLERVSDITLGDSWGSSLADAEKRKGISLIMCQTDKGHELVLGADINLQRVEVKKAIMANSQLSSPERMPKNRPLFFQAINKTGSFKAGIFLAFPSKAVKHTLKKYIISYILKKNEKDEM